MTPQDITQWEEETLRRTEQAANLFRSGYNCSQSVTMALADLYDISPTLMARIAASFGGGIGRMRETCGTACGMFLLAGLEVTDIQDKPLLMAANTADPYPSAALKKANYQVVQRLAQDFRRECGSLLCSELLGLARPQPNGSVPQVPITATPEERTQAYYQRRPCVKMVETAVRIYMNYLREKYT